ncbi:MAG: excinuclease ABC subunit UvrC [Peptococcaceae bacterium]|jgi:excinuclease ABC subunit C|nr:excinuclease ABC subunit UvrC [Peptococcaceae bacterium]
MELLQQKTDILPCKPGVYLMKDTEGQIIYIGKAKILKNRVRSYFTGSHDGKTQRLVGSIADFEYIVTDSEVEALVLECNLIKKHTPKYNILLKDDKSYPYLLITHEQHPRLISTRQVSKGKGRYYGPYPNATAAREAARLLNRLFPLRKCKQLPRQSCIYFHLKQCLGPCIQPIPATAYARICKEINSFLKGGQNQVIRVLEAKMQAAVDSLHFELAKQYRDLILDIKSLGEQQKITLTDFIDRDVIGYALQAEHICIQIFYLRQGKMIARDHFVFPYIDDAEEAFTTFVAQFYAQDHRLAPREILLPPMENPVLQDFLPVLFPRRGQKRKLLELANQNAKMFLEESFTLKARTLEDQENALLELSAALGIPLPNRIECFDISNLGATNVVAGMVQFLNGQPYRSGYRKFNIHFAGAVISDTAALYQAVERRYSRVLKEKLPFPDLILIDGGKGQVKAAREALAQLKLSLPVAGLVKNERHQTESLLDHCGNPVLLLKNTAAFRFLERIQTEVHRFALTFHRQQRNRKMTESLLEAIPGIGPKRRQTLMIKFKSLERLRAASTEELTAAGLPQHTALNVYRHFHP